MYVKAQLILENPSLCVVSGKPVVSIKSRFNTSRFDTNSSSEIAQKCCSPQVQFVSEQEKHFE